MTSLSARADSGETLARRLVRRVGVVPDRVLNYRSVLAVRSASHIETAVPKGSAILVLPPVPDPLVVGHRNAASDRWRAGSRVYQSTR